MSKRDFFSGIILLAALVAMFIHTHLGNIGYVIILTGLSVIWVILRTRNK